MKNLICFLLLCFYTTSTSAQTNYSMALGFSVFNYKGGFTDAKNVRTSGGLAHFSVSHFKQDKHIGIVGGFTIGRIYTASHRPSYFLCQEASTGNTMVCQSKNIYLMQIGFNSYQLSAGGALRIGQFLEFSLSPFLGIHSRQGVDIMGLEPALFYPVDLKDKYSRFELGGQARLTLRLNLGKHFNLNIQGHAGSTFTDMRQGNWTDARSYIFDAPEGANWIKLESSKLTRRFYGISVGVGIK